MEGKPPPISGQDGRRALEVAVAAYASQEKGAPVEVG
jgi:predicted dehydrogenase